MTYCIHSFMCEELKLSGGELLVFAMIHSFTKGERGSYYGTQDYLARSGGMSVSTVKRSIASLLKKEYITECSYGERRGYKTTPRAEPVACADAEHCTKAAEYPLAPRDTKNDSFDIDNPDLYADLHPKHVYHGVGKDGLIQMTPEQYKSLLKLVESDVLFAYVRKMELLIMDNSYRFSNPYKTIKKWILEDTAL